ncbi:phosphopentomutase, partial [Thermodesulfobacteriota bacterium]
KEIIDEVTEKIGRGILANYAASGTEIIKVLGEEHVKTGKPILYTSADSVMQIAAHEEVISLNELYKMCEIARKICDKHCIGRVIARPFLGEAGNFYRTPNRRDFSILPFKRTILDMLKDAGKNVIGVGKIEDIFAARGITHAIHTKSNAEGMEVTAKCMEEFDSGLIFTNLVEFDMLFGHRNDSKGYAKALEEFDVWLATMMGHFRDDDLLIITADHGCDPTTTSTDHSREYVPLIVYNKANENGKSLPLRASFCDVAKTIAKVFGVTEDICGESFLADIL